MSLKLPFGLIAIILISVSFLSLKYRPPIIFTGAVVPLIADGSRSITSSGSPSPAIV
jgi:hypothetical protein